jgi:hypothetical protein
MTRTPALPLLLLALGACTPPPPAPQGLDAASAYLVRNFYADDATFQAGVQGFMDWFENGNPPDEPPGKELLGLVPGESSGKSTDAFTVGDLTAEDVALLPLAEEILLNPNTEERGPRDLSAAAGVVSLAEMDCSWTEAEALLVRPDQDTVFDGDWEGYDRTYVTDPDDFQAASAAAEFARVAETLDPFVAGFDFEPYATTFLFTDNMADPTAVLGADMPSYPLDLDMRHGIYEIFGEDVGVLAIITYNTEAVYGPAGDNGLTQSYSIEINVERAGGKTLRMLAVWAEPFSSLINPDSPLALNYAVNKSKGSSDRMSAVCAGDVTLDE